MLDAIREDDELYHRILRYDVRFLHSHALGVTKLIERASQPIPLDDFVALAVTLGLPARGSQSKVTKFLDEQVRRHLPRGKDFRPILNIQAVHFQAPPSGGRR